MTDHVAATPAPSLVPRRKEALPTRIATMSYATHAMRKESS